MRKIALALALTLLAAEPAFAVCTVIPALPDTERRTEYTGIVAQTGPFNVGFQLYGDSTDYANWFEVWVNGVKKTAVTDYTVATASGPAIGAACLPITNAQVTFLAAQTGTIEIVGARRPRRASQVSENAGVTAHDFNQIVSDLTAAQRERWDLTARTLRAPPGNTLTVLPLAATRAGGLLSFDASGNPSVTSPPTGLGTVIGPATTVIGNAVTWNSTNGTLVADAGAPPITNPYTGNLALTPASGNALTITGASGLNKSLTVTQTGTGSDLSGNNVILNDFNLTNNVDTFSGACSGTCGAGVFGQRVAMTTGGASNQGSAVSYLAEGVLTATRTGGQQWTGGGFWTNISTAASSGGTGTTLANARGSIIPFFAGATLSSGATNYLSIEGMEIGLAMKTGSTAAIAAGLWIGRGGDAVAGAITDCAACVVSSGTGQWGVGLQIGDMATTGSQPIAATGTLIKATAASGAPSVASFIDFSAYACSGGSEIVFSTNFRIDCNGSIITAGNFNTIATGVWSWTGRSILQSPANGIIELCNNACNDFTRLQLGGTTSSFPAIKRNAAAVNFRLADDSADAAITAAGGTFSGATTISGASLTMSGNISSAAWTTSGVRYKGVAATFTDTTSSGTVAAAYTSVHNGGTIAASSATTFTDYIGSFFTTPAAGTNVTLTRKWPIGADSSFVTTAYLSGFGMKNEGGSIVTMIDSGASGRYLRFLNPDGIAVFQAGNTNDATMYLDHTTIQFTNLANNVNWGKFDANGLTIQTGNITMSTAAKTLVLKQGANGSVGTFICTSGGSITVTNSNVAVTDTIIISLNTAGGTISNAPALNAITAATSFVAKCATNDTSTYNYAIIKNAA